MQKSKFKIRPKKHFGQNFLADRRVLNKIIETAQLKGDETVIEVGAGDGALTRSITNYVLSIKGTGKILALELDYRLVEKLREEFKNSQVVKIVHADALKFGWEGLPKNYKVVANLPYQLTSPLLNLWCFSLSNQPRSLTLMVQKEVGERLTAPPGSAKRGLMTIIVELFGEAEYIQTIPAKAFYPVPKVNSAIIHIRKSNIKNLKSDNRGAIIAIAKAGFSAKRRTLLNSLSGSLRLPKSQVSELLKKAGLDPSRRAETLTVSEWSGLVKVLK